MPKKIQLILLDATVPVVVVDIVVAFDIVVFVVDRAVVQLRYLKVTVEFVVQRLFSKYVF